MTEADLLSVSFSQKASSHRNSCSLTTSDLVLVKHLTVSKPIVLSKIETNNNSTLKLAQMTISDGDGAPVGTARAHGAQWHFISPVFLFANKSYSVSIDRVLVYTSLNVHTFHAYMADTKFKGTTGDNFLKLYFWPATPRVSN